MKIRGQISTTKLAKICGVSQGTVDRALNNRSGIKAETREKILSAAKKYGYRPNIHARNLAGGKSMLIGVVVFDLDNEYFSEFLMRFEEECAKMGYSTVVMFTHKDSEREIECIKNLYYMSVDGIALFPCNIGEDFEEFLASLEIPIACIGNRLNGFEYIGIDNRLAMKEAAEYVINKGYEKLIYIKPQLNQPNCFAQTERLGGFEELCISEGLEYAITSLNNIEKEIDTSKRCAIVCPTDIYAIRLLKTAQEKAVGIIGFDNLKIIDSLNLKLDSVAYDVSATAVYTADHLINGTPPPKTITHKIINRGSV